MVRVRVMRIMLKSHKIAYLMAIGIAAIVLLSACESSNDTSGENFSDNIEKVNSVNTESGQYPSIDDANKEMEDNLEGWDRREEQHFKKVDMDIYVDSDIVFSFSNESRDEAKIIVNYNEENRYISDISIYTKYDMEGGSGEISNIYRRINNILKCDILDLVSNAEDGNDERQLESEYGDIEVRIHKYQVKEEFEAWVKDEKAIQRVHELQLEVDESKLGHWEWIEEEKSCLVCSIEITEPEMVEVSSGALISPAEYLVKSKYLFSGIYNENCNLFEETSYTNIASAIGVQEVVPVEAYLVKGCTLRVLFNDVHYGDTHMLGLEVGSDEHGDYLQYDNKSTIGSWIDRRISNVLCDGGTIERQEYEEVTRIYI